MNRALRATIGVIFVLVITFTAITICQNLFSRMKVDVTDQGLYTLSEGTKSIINRLNQPMRMKLYYTKTAAMEGPDQIRYFNNYYRYVRTLLEEYEANSNGMIDLEIIDPRPYSEEEVEALRYGLQRFPITEEESFFFGLVLQTQFGVEKTIPFFSPDRQNFIEYDVSYLIDTAITREKKKIGVISSLPVFGEDVSGYMAQMMRMQGQQPKPAWGIIDQLREQYEVEQIASDANSIDNIDMLMVIHPKDFSDETLFAIDQYIMKGNSAVILVDPHCMSDQPDKQQQMMRQMQSQSSDINRLLRAWGAEVPQGTFAGDRSLAIKTALRRNQRPETIIGFLQLRPECFDRENVVTGQLNDVKLLFAGVIRDYTAGEEMPEGASYERIPLVTTTNMGNSFKVESYELMMMDPGRLMDNFIDGTEPVEMGAIITGTLPSAFPDGITVEVADADQDNGEGEQENAEQENGEAGNEPKTKTITGLARSLEPASVVVFTDVDFISDMLAYNQSIFGKMVVGDNSALISNAIEYLQGSSDLIAIRSRGNFKRPFEVVEDIELQAEAETAAEEARLQAEIEKFENELREIRSSGKEEEDLVGSSVVSRIKDLELKIRQSQRQLREVKLNRRKRIDRLENNLRNINMLGAPAVILVIAIILAVRRTIKRRGYIKRLGTS